MKSRPSYQEIATNYRLWQIYADPSGLDSEEAFDSMTSSEKEDILEASFGMEWDTTLQIDNN